MTVKDFNWNHISESWRPMGKVYDVVNHHNAADSLSEMLLPEEGNGPLICIWGNLENVNLLNPRLIKPSNDYTKLEVNQLNFELRQESNDLYSAELSMKPYNGKFPRIILAGQVRGADICFHMDIADLGLQFDSNTRSGFRVLKYIR